MKKNIQIFLCTILLCSGIVFNTCFALDNQSQAYDLYLKSYKEYQNRNYLSAISYLEQAKTLMPDSYEYTYWLGINYASMVSVEEASSFKKAAQMAGMTDFSPDTNLQKAKEYFTRAIEIDPNRWQGYIGIARIYDGLNITPIAVMYYDKALNLPSMPDNVKAEYLKYKNDMIARQNTKEQSVVSNNNDCILYKSGIDLHLDKNKWNLAYCTGDEKYWMAEFGQQGEDVVNYKWTKLYSIHFFNVKNYNMTFDEVYKYKKNLLEEQARDINSELTISKIFEDENNFYFKWSIKNFNESEIERMTKTPHGFYSLRYTSKLGITPEEQGDIFKILLNATLQ